jgi:hypothetical protein
VRAVGIAVGLLILLAPAVIGLIFGWPPIPSWDVCIPVNFC